MCVVWEERSNNTKNVVSIKYTTPGIGLPPLIKITGGVIFKRLAI